MDDSPQSEGARASRNRSLDWRRALWRRVRSAVRLRGLYLLRAEIRFAPTEAQRLFLLTIVIGVVCGLAAVAFHIAITLASHALIDQAMSAPGRSWIGWTLATPTLGALACGVVLQYVVPNARGSGIPQVKIAFAVRGGRLRLRDSVGKFIVGALQIGSGSSLGREGPTVQICAGVASFLGRITQVSPKALRRLIPVGAAAGIAAAFNAPIAAVTFTIEEVVGNLDQTVLSGVIIAAALAAVIERSVLGAHPVFDVPQRYDMQHASSLAIYAILGVAAAAVSVAFTDSLLALRLWFRTSRLPPWACPGVGGLVVGALAVLAWWQLGTRGVTGGGYDTLSAALTGSLGINVMLVLCLMKLVATVFSYASGGAGGIFAPALFIGGMLGGAVGRLDSTLLHHTGEPIGAFALVGMGAVFAGIIRAPMTSVLIIIEMTGGYSLILPLMLANMTAYILARHARPIPIYEALLEQDGVYLSTKRATEEVESLPLEQFTNGAAPLRSFRMRARAADVVKGRTEEPTQLVYPVVDDAGKIVGIITPEEIAVLASEPELLTLVNAADLMRPTVSVDLDDDLGFALQTMISNGLSQLPIIDRTGRCVGLVTEADIAKAYQRLQRPKSAPEFPKGDS
ncbi:MAG: chloride channel protein [Myxococcota bacterium]|nr:chloride channel protein [Myxococcota bacterium]